MPSRNFPEGLGKAEDITGTEWGPSSSRRVSQGQPQGLLSALEMVDLELLHPSFSILGLCRGCVWLGVRQRNRQGMGRERDSCVAKPHSKLLPQRQIQLMCVCVCVCTNMHVHAHVLVRVF